MPVDDTKLDEDFAELLNSVNKEYEAAYSRLSCASVVKNTEKLKGNLDFYFILTLIKF